MQSIEIIMQPVKDRQQAKEFYLKLGFKVLIEATDPHGDAWIQMGVPGSETTISLSSFPGLIFSVEDIQASIKKLEADGLHAGKIDFTPWGKFAWFKDMDGNSLCFHQKP